MLLKDFEIKYKAIKDAENELYNLTDRHLETDDCNLKTENSLLDRRLHLEGKQMEALGKETGYSRLRAWYFEEMLKHHKINNKNNPTVEDYKAV